MPPIVSRRTLPLLCLVALGLVLVASLPAVACPTCKDGIAQNDTAQQNMARGYFWSILFMMSMPFLLLGGFSAYMYLEIRKARARADKSATSSDGPLSKSSRSPLPSPGG